VNRVFVLDIGKKPLQPTHAAKARILLKEGKAAVYHGYAFTIILKYAVDKLAESHLRLKIDPGSRTTGIAIVNDKTKEVLFAAEISHRGHVVKQDLDKRCAIRRSRRDKKTRYRKPRFNNRRRKEGWLSPSLESRLGNIGTWVPSHEIRSDHGSVRGTRQAGYEVKQYLLKKWGYECAYCPATDVPLEVEHIIPKSRGGADRVSNLTIACKECNRRKDNRTAAEFGLPRSC
jgi:5-methylcytosine-specific restriction endonuclease McrA